MKIRNGFVTNSSSSSFIVIGCELEFDQYTKILEALQKKYEEKTGQKLFNPEEYEDVAEYSSEEGSDWTYDVMDGLSLEFDWNSDMIWLTICDPLEYLEEHTAKQGKQLFKETYEKEFGCKIDDDQIIFDTIALDA